MRDRVLSVVASADIDLVAVAWGPPGKPLVADLAYPPLTIGIPDLTYPYPHPGAIYTDACVLGHLPRVVADALSAGIGSTTLNI